MHSSRFTSRLRHLEEGGGKADQLGKVMQLIFLHLESQIQGGKVMQLLFFHKLIHFESQMKSVFLQGGKARKAKLEPSTFSERETGCR